MTGRRRQAFAPHFLYRQPPRLGPLRVVLDRGQAFLDPIGDFFFVLVLGVVFRRRQDITVPPGTKSLANWMIRSLTEREQRPKRGGKPYSHFPVAQK